MVFLTFPALELAVFYKAAEWYSVLCRQELGSGKRKVTFLCAPVEPIKARNVESSSIYVLSVWKKLCIVFIHLGLVQKKNALEWWQECSHLRMSEPSYSDHSVLGHLESKATSECMILEILQTYILALIYT